MKLKLLYKICSDVEKSRDPNPARFLVSRNPIPRAAAMELLSAAPPPDAAANTLDGARSTADLRRLFDGEGSVPPGSRDGVHVAVGLSPAKTSLLLQWTFQKFQCKEVGLVHVHQPSPMIPTLLGKLPASKANEQIVSAYRREEMEATKRVLLSYLSICYRAQVQANIVITECEHIQKGIVDLVEKNCIRKLVVGAITDNCFKVKGSSRKVTYTAKNAPPFCEIWFVSKGKHVWTREASETSYSHLQVLSPFDSLSGGRIRPSLLHNLDGEAMLEPECSRFSYFPHVGIQGANTEELFSITGSDTYVTDQINSRNSSASTISLNSPDEIKEELEALYKHLREVTMEIERSKKEMFEEQTRREKVEAEVSESFSGVKACEASLAQEKKSRERLESLLTTVMQQKEELEHQRNEARRELSDVTKTIIIVDGQAQEVARRRDKAVTELDLIQSSIETLMSERQKIQWQRDESVQQLKRLRYGSRAKQTACNKCFGFGDNTFNFKEFSLSDLQAATCDFSESFKLGEGGYGCVYKGEILNTSVVIKKLHQLNVQGQLEFQQEVNVLGKLRHPHLLTLIGACPEALSLVYEYLPNLRSLHDLLFRRITSPPLTWKVRTRIMAQISSVALFLHSSKPEKVIHGDLKPRNIFLDSNFNCRIGDFGICRLVPNDVGHHSFSRQSAGPKDAYPYADPEYQRTGVLTPKSDVYSFGIIILQLLTGRPPLALASEVRRAISSGRLSSILDATAGEWPADVARRLAELGSQCCEMNIRDRPELTPEVVRDLEQLYVQEERPVPHFFLCPILQEIMVDPQVAADGFTYEGNAMRGWLENGRETSPMTNLKLEHLNLTPNHSLRFAIHDWLCGSSTSRF